MVSSRNIIIISVVFVVIIIITGIIAAPFLESFLKDKKPDSSALDPFGDEDDDGVPNIDDTDPYDPNIPVVGGVQSWQEAGLYTIAEPKPIPGLSATLQNEMLWKIKQITSQYKRINVDFVEKNEEKDYLLENNILKTINVVRYNITDGNDDISRILSILHDYIPDYEPFSEDNPIIILQSGSNGGIYSNIIFVITWEYNIYKYGYSDLDTYETLSSRQLGANLGAAFGYITYDELYEREIILDALKNGIEPPSKYLLKEMKDKLLYITTTSYVSLEKLRDTGQFTNEYWITEEQSYI